jgi:signal transduction histidine kinase
MLSVPFHAAGSVVGTLWVVLHDDHRRFDAEDARLIESLAKFGAAACEVSALRERADTDLADRHATAVRLEKEVNDRDRLMAILGHELRSQLGASKNAAELLKCETLDAAGRKYSIGIIDRMVVDITRVVGDLLDVARVRAGIFELQRTGIVLGDVVERALEIAAPVTVARRHTLVVNIPPEPIRFEADPLWLAQALQNVLSNAAKYTESGGRITVDVRRDGADAVVSVSDTGIGIEPAEVDAIFDLYARGRQAAASNPGGGLGIGLYLVRRVVEGHGGSIRAVSAGSGRGSEFTIRLPCGPPQRAQVAT